MKPAAAATLPAAIRLTPKKRRRRYSHGWIRRCRPGRGGVSHHPRRPFAAVLSLGAFIGMPPAGCGAGHPVTYQRDITLIPGLSMVAVLTGRLGDGASVRVTCPVPLENGIRSVTCRSCVCQAACEYSLIRPPRMGFRRI